MEPNTTPSLETQPLPPDASNVLRRVEELEQQAIAAPGDLFPINLFSAQLVRISLKLVQSIEANWGAPASLVQANPRVLPAVDLLLKVHRQGERNTRLTSDLQKAAATKLQRLGQAASEET